MVRAHIWVWVEHDGGDHMCTRFASSQLLAAATAICTFLKVPEYYRSTAMSDSHHSVAHGDGYSTRCTM